VINLSYLFVNTLLGRSLPKKHLAIFNQLDVPRFKQFHAKTVERKIQGLQVHLAEMKALKTMLKDWDTFGLDEL